jgi:hypothetical protein
VRKAVKRGLSWPAAVALYRGEMTTSLAQRGLFVLDVHPFT